MSAAHDLGLPVDAILLVIGLAVGRILILRIVRRTRVMTMRPDIMPDMQSHFG
jgi:hypothetical protein